MAWAAQGNCAERQTRRAALHPTISYSFQSYLRVIDRAAPLFEVEPVSILLKACPNGTVPRRVCAEPNGGLICIPIVTWVFFHRSIAVIALAAQLAARNLPTLHSTARSGGLICYTK